MKDNRTDAARAALLHAIADRLAAIEADRSLLRPGRFVARGEALDDLDLHVRGPLASLAAHPGHAPIARRAAALQARLERSDDRLAQRLRRAIRAGAARPAWWLDIMIKYSAPPDPADREADLRYDSLDDLVQRVLQIEPPQGALRELPAEMVAYQPTPARLLPAIVAGARLTPADVFYDIGSGLGQVPILAALLSGARALGVEIQPAYVASARRCAAGLGLERVAFVAEDALAADLRAGTVFYLYTPLRGAALQALLDSIGDVARAHPLRVCCYGPCVAAVAAQPWLVPADGGGGPVHVFRAG
jgi:hypothetical protein